MGVGRIVNFGGMGRDDPPLLITDDGWLQVGRPEEWELDARHPNKYFYVTLLGAV
jgi:hypothetical protein